MLQNFKKSENKLCKIILVGNWRRKPSYLHTLGFKVSYTHRPSRFSICINGIQSPIIPVLLHWHITQWALCFFKWFFRGDIRTEPDKAINSDSWAPESHYINIDQLPSKKSIEPSSIH